MPDLDERFRSLERLRTPDLWDDIGSREPSRPVRETSRRGRWVTAAVAFAVAAAGTIFAVEAFRPGGSSTTTSVVTNGRIAFSGVDGTSWNIFTIEPDGIGLTEITHLSDQVAEDPVWSPDGARIAYVVVENGGGGRSDIWTMNANGSDPIRLTEGSGSNWSPTWSPDGTMIAYTHSAPGQAEQIWVMDANGSDPRAFTLCGSECLRDSSPAWSPDGSRIAFVRVSGSGAVIPVSVMIWPVDASGRVDPSRSPSDVSIEGATWASDLAWSPDGSELAFARSTSDGASFGLWVMNADGSKVSPWGDVASAQSPTWSPDGRTVAFTGVRPGTDHNTLYLMDADGTGAREISGLPVEATFPSWQPLVEGPSPTVVPAPPNARLAFAWYDGSSYQIFTANADGSHVRQITRMPISVSDPAWSPDGSRIAFQGETVGGEGGRLDIYISNADGTGVTQLAHGPDSYQHPSWSPDGTTIAVTRWSASDGRGDVVVLAVDGSGETVVTHGGAGDSWRPVWSPDGSRLAYVSNRDANGDLNDEIWVVSADGSNAHDLTNSLAYDRDPTWSPDGTRIAYFSGPDGSPDLATISVEGGGQQTLVPNVEDGGAPAWSPDGAEIAFVRDDLRLGTGRLEIVDLASGSVAEPLDLVGVGSPAWQPVPVGASEPSSTPSTSIQPTITATAADVIPIEKKPGAVSALSYGLGSVWVASFDTREQGWLTRLDPSTGESLARISTGDVFPTWEVGGGALTTGFGSVWMAGAEAAQGEPTGVHAYLLRIDPATNQVIATIDLRASGPADIAVDDTGVWVMSFGLGERPSMEVSRIDPVNDEVAATIPLDSWYGHHLFSVSGWIVASTNAGAPEQHGAIPDGVLNVIDPQSETEVLTVPVGPSAWPAAGDDALWVATGDTLERIDPASGNILAQYQVPNTGDALAVGEGGVWFLEPQGRTTVDRLDPALGAVDLKVRLPDETTPIAMTPSPGTLWVLNYEGSVTRVDLT